MLIAAFAFITTLTIAAVLAIGAFVSGAGRRLLLLLLLFVIYVGAITLIA